MNFKTTKALIIRVVKDFICVTCVGAMILLIAMMFFAESVIFSKEVLGLLIGVAILFLGIGGIVSAILIFFSCCTQKISKLEKNIAERDRIIAKQSNQLNEAKAVAKRICSTPSTPQAPKSSAKERIKDIFDVLAPLSEETETENTPVAHEISDQEEVPPQESTPDENT